jgi:glycosyltransferase involved in cell wall biosynthesis
MSFDENEISVKSFGGTELSKRSIEKGLDPALLKSFQIIPARVRDIDMEKIRVFYAHDLPLDPEASHLKESKSYKRFHKFVYVSNWQYQQYVDKLGFTPSVDHIVIENPVQPIEYIEKSKDQIRLIYLSTPQRGLEILVPVFEKLVEKHPNIQLDVFSSFEIYGWSEADKPWQSLFDKCKTHPNINYHGFQPNDIVRQALQDAHIFAYPSIWQETSCRCLIEAMSAGLLCVHPNYGALPDTSGGLTAMYDMDVNKNKHAAELYGHLDHAIAMVNHTDVQKYLQFVKHYADHRFNLPKITNQWDQLLHGLLHKYPTVESRQDKKEFFRYGT